jgi:hypothetical protein
MFALFAQAAPLSNLIVLVLVGAGVVVLLIVFAVFARYFRLWIQSITTGKRTTWPAATCRW